MPILVAAVALLGLAVGSFLNVVIHRVPRGESLLRPASHCPTCGCTVRFRHNVPVVSWLALRGRCADCAAPISPRYILVELTTAVLFVGTAVSLARLHLLAALPAYLFFVSAGIALAAIDASVMRLPNEIVYPSYVVLAALLGGASLAEGTVQPLVRAGIASAVLFVLFLGIALANPTGLGWGDVKFAGVIGAALGFLSYPAVIVGVLAAFVLGGGFAAALLAVHRTADARPQLLPFGPAMVAGAMVALFAAHPLAAVVLPYVPSA